MVTEVDRDIFPIFSAPVLTMVIFKIEFILRFQNVADGFKPHLAFVIPPPRVFKVRVIRLIRQFDDLGKISPSKIFARNLFIFRDFHKLI